MNSVAYLIKRIEGGVDSLGQPIETETKRMIYCRVESVKRSEWFDAGRIGLNASIVVRLHKSEYDDEDIVEYNGTRFSVYRTYFDSKTEDIELYLEKKAGTL